MFGKGIDIGVIAECSGLPENEIQRLMGTESE
uniref:Uncharacterized protein n=1 Tax=Candidatus Kentrum sp. FM TaxID=2126340 RepID=A0A450VX72_9GAMM|nr:MAG: hypothetical protein BECKFM1743C_GA0114222_101092 [Candidatus Kentron sp. FM]VFJ76813.1 MAG: hypothetical protein BECKFM1743A_GA0114220_109462 [Candidatus Kentron sp. FM]VFK09413.1 MAG: hypothetical protein BECKFM1743B_GA0114221_101042 [Candidatus Kentron sp. FM]